jgi:hypothetical protein
MTQLFNQAHEQINSQSNNENIMFLIGGDFTYMNAMSVYDNLRLGIKYCNELGAALNISCSMSTPKSYVNSLKSEKVNFPIKYDDFMNYYE